MTKIKPQEIEALTRTFEASQWQELEFSTKGFDLFLTKNPESTASWLETPTNQEQPKVSPPAQTIAGNRGDGAMETVTDTATTGIADLGHGLHVIKAPTIGTFYRSAKPGAPPFVKIGQKVEIDTELCLIEVMKLFTTVRSDVSGIIREILSENGGIVEYGQPLFLIEEDM